MRFRAIAGAMLAPALAVSVASAQAPAPTGPNACVGLNTADVNFGSPHNTADKTQVTCTDLGDGTQVALSAVARFSGANPNPPAVVETSPGSGVYFASNGEGNPVGSGLAVWNFNYAITGFSAGDIFELLIDRNPGDGTTFQTKVLIFGDNPDTKLGYQNSENEGFFNAGADVFDPMAVGTYTIEVDRLGAIDGPVLDHASININVVASPEPASIALFATGFSGLGMAGFVRRRRNSKAA